METTVTTSLLADGRPYRRRCRAGWLSGAGRPVCACCEGEPLRLLQARCSKRWSRD